MSKLIDYDGDNLGGLAKYRDCLASASTDNILARYHQLCCHTPLITRAQNDEANLLCTELIKRGEAMPNMAELERVAACGV